MGHSEISDAEIDHETMFFVPPNDSSTGFAMAILPRDVVYLASDPSWPLPT